jgi:hypothetical protein
MVNGGFPRCPDHGFELVDANRGIILAVSIENLRRIKRRGFFRFFCRIKSNAMSCDLSRIARAFSSEVRAATAAAFVSDERDRKMFFLLRMAFWLGLVLVLLPREKTPESEKLPQISVGEAVQAATAAVSDMSQFCARQPQACHVGGQAATVIGVRAEDGARKIYRSITDKKSDDKKDPDKKPDDKADKKDADKKSPDHTGSIGVADNGDNASGEAISRDTLTSDDLAVDWRGVP